MKPIELLVVDDNAAETLLLLNALEDCPAQINVHFAKNGPEGLRMLRKGNFDLVFLDLNLPGLSGYDVLERCDPKRVPIVIFSVSSNDSDAKRALALGAREFVHKPTRLESYKHAVLTTIEKWALGAGRKTVSV